ncbi:signal peptidase I [Paenibacillus thalictri]|uniref:Signal peptidase I n=1 Tax=Paenibacillus thalictri TaxID=2527873 RepID=A0A4Q9DG99_9BACL|nr:signal peptidase I [Paenibacillus thalictri]TBL71172.1 signal peptidase I [Paenibacillus thalictri]
MFNRLGKDRSASCGLEPLDSQQLTAEIWEWFKAIVAALLLVVLVHQFGFHLSSVAGSSMQPTLYEGELLFINKTLRFIGSPRRGDIVIIRSTDPAQLSHPYLVKRVVGLPGDTVEVRQNQLFVNDEPLTESYTDGPVEDGRFIPYTVDEDSYFVMGDNRHRSASYDSRSFGAVSAGQIEGRAECILWPFNKFKVL